MENSDQLPVSNTNKPLLVIGPGGHARVVIDAALESGFTLRGIIDPAFSGEEEQILGIPVLGNAELLNDFDPELFDIAIAIGSNQKREIWIQRVTSLGYNLPPIVHPTAIVSKHVNIGAGVFINAGVIINAMAKIGVGSIINTGATIDHDTSIGRAVHVGPGCRISGRVKVGAGTFIGTGSSIIDYINIGDEVMIGAGSVIIKDIESHATVVGVPGRKIK